MKIQAELDTALKMLNQGLSVKDINISLDFNRLTKNPNLIDNNQDFVNNLIKENLSNCIKNKNHIPLISEWMSRTPKNTVDHILNTTLQKQELVELKKLLKTIS